MSQAVAGVPSLWENFVLGSELGTSVVFAFVAAVAATVTAAGVRKTSAVTVLLVTPGLLGALIVSLLVLALFQLPILHAFYDTPLPLGLALTMLLLPLAFLTGVTGAFFKALSLTMAVSLVASFLIAWLVTPILVERLYRDADPRPHAEGRWGARYRGCLERIVAT